MLVHDVIEQFLLAQLKPATAAVMVGQAGCGKSQLALRVGENFPGSVFCFIALSARKGKCHLLAVGQQGGGGYREGALLSCDSFWQMALTTFLACGQHCLVVVDNAHKLTETESFIDTFHQIAIHAKKPLSLLLVGRDCLNKKKNIRQLCPVWVTIPAARKIVSGAEAPVSENRQKLLTKIARLSGGNLRFVNAIAGTIRPGEAEEKVGQVRQITGLIAQAFPSAGRAIPLILGYALLLFPLGWLSGSLWQLPIPVPQWIKGQPVAVVEAATVPKITDQIADERSGMQGLLSAWGYEVTRDEAWCDTVESAGLLCHSGDSTLDALTRQQLPWMARINVNQQLLYPVVMRVTGDELDLLIDKGIWTVKRGWFTRVWHGHYTILWKTGPVGARRIGPKSTPSQVIWLDGVLSRALNIPASPDEKWQPVLTKLRLFQKRHGLPVDGIAGKMTLIRLMQETGESPKLMVEAPPSMNAIAMPVEQTP